MYLLKMRLLTVTNRRLSFYLILPALILIRPVDGFSQIPSDQFKQLAGPPTEFAAMAKPDPTVSAVRSKSALLPVELSKGPGGRWTWQSDIPVEGDELRLAVISKPGAAKNAWKLKIRDPDRNTSRSGDDPDVERHSKELGIAQDKLPSEVFVFRNMQPGRKTLEIESDDASERFVLIEGRTSVRLLSHQAAFNQQVGQRITLVASVVRDDTNVVPSSEITEAKLSLTTPSGRTLVSRMRDDGLHGDVRAGDGSFAADFMADEPGSFVAQVLVRGRDGDSNHFLRTGEHLIPVVDKRLRIQSHTAPTSRRSPHRVAIHLDVDSSETDGHYRVVAQVWGRDASGKGPAAVPVAWIGGMAVLSGKKLTLGLDTRWIDRSGAGPPFELRNVRVEDPDYFITLALADRIPIAISAPSTAAASTDARLIDEEMANGPRPAHLPEASSTASATLPTGTGHKLLLVHGYCSDNVWGPVAGQFSNSAIFLDLGANRSHDAFATRIKSFGNTWNSYSIVAHSQGGAAALHLYTYQWSGLDNAGPGRLIQSVGTPYQGTPLAGNLAILGQLFGQGCGSNYNLTTGGAAVWLAGIPPDRRSKVHYHTTSFTDYPFLPDNCSPATDLLLDDPDDGVTEQIRGQLPGGVNQGHKTGWCHISNMRDPGQVTDGTRNTVMNNYAAASSSSVSLSATAVSSTQINLSWWIHESPTKFHYSLERRPFLGTWSEIALVATTARNYSDFGLAPGTRYQYRIRTVNSSEFSNWVDVTTPPVAGTTRTLSIQSSNPSSGVAVNSYVGSGQFAAGITPTIRTLAYGSAVTVSCPPSLASGQIFQRWQRNGVDFSYNTTTTVSLDANHTLTAIYGAGAPPPRALSNLTIQGPSSVDEESSVQYSATATYTDGSSGEVPASWGVNNPDCGSISSTGRLDASAVSLDIICQIQAQYTLGITTRSDTQSVTVVNTDVTPTYTLSRSASHGSISRSPSMSAYPAGTEVRLNASADDGYLFSHWSGDASGTSRTTYITMTSNKSVTANFIPDLSEGTIRVFVEPQQANAEGAGWKASGNGYYPLNYLPSGDSRTLKPGRYSISYRPIQDWVEPNNQSVDLIGGETATINGTYRELRGSVQVTITPAAANVAGARWRVDNGPWLESGTTATDLESGNHTLEFKTIDGWGVPESRVVPIARNTARLEYANYDPPLGQPLITSISPASGPRQGGTVVTIHGANFESDADVTFGELDATTVNVQSATQLTATTPARLSYGSVDVSVSSNDQTASRANGFSYLNASGANIDLISQIGGNVNTVTVSGNLVYYGEGPGLVIADYSNPSAPVERGRIPLPGLVRDITLEGTTAFVAADAAGVFAINVSLPASPAVVGFYDTDGDAWGVFVLDDVAYVADNAAGLLILDVSSPQAMVSLGSLDTAGRAEQVAAAHIGNGTYAYIAEGTSALQVIDVSEPANAIEVDSIPSNSNNGYQSVQVVGTTVYASDWQVGLKIFDSTDPSNLTQIGSKGGTGVSFIAVQDDRLYNCGGSLLVLNVAVLPNPTILGQMEIEPSCSDVAVSGGLAFVAGGSDGLYAFNVSNPSAMSLRSVRKSLGYVEEVFPLNNTLLVGTNYGLQTVDISNPSAPVWRGTLAWKGVDDIVAFDGKATLVSTAEEEVLIADVTSAASPSVLGTYTDSEAWSVGLSGQNPVLGARDDALIPRLDVLSIAVPSSPQKIGSSSIGTSSAIIQTITARNNWGFAGTSGSSHRIEVLDLSTPTSPRVVGGMETSEFVPDIAATASGDYAFIPSDAGVQVIDARTKSAPAVVATIDPPQVAGSSSGVVDVLGDRLYADNSGWIFAFDISDPVTPEVLGFYDVPLVGNSIASKDNLIFVAGGNAGVQILQLGDVDVPTVAITTPTANTTYSTDSDSIAISGVAADNGAVSRVTWDNDRGGGGVATGTTAWTIDSIQLAFGLNRISVTAEDLGGNHATDVVEVTASFPDATPPVVLITAPKPDDIFTVEDETIELAGSVVDNEQIASVTWSNDRGGAGTAVSTGDAWSAGTVSLALGVNVIEVTAVDAADNTATDSAVVFRVASDTDPPSITIDFPTLSATFYTKESTLNLSGTGTDNRSVDRIEWSNSNGATGVASGTSPWFVNEIALSPGLNVIDVFIYDDSGQSASDTLVVTFDPCPGPDGDEDCTESFNVATDGCDAPDPDGIPCDDGTFCNGLDSCASGSCESHAGDPCAAGAECANECSESNDSCLSSALTDCADDANPCTLDRCNGLGECVHSPGNSGSVCRAAVSNCDTQELCSGTGSTCPVDAVAPTSTICRGSSGVCDIAERCTGASTICPQNAFASASTTCRGATGSCDLAESCTGTSATCPTNLFALTSTVCRISIGICDSSEVCTGTSGQCPPNVFLTSSLVCRGSNGMCDVQEACTGTSSGCPTDAVAGSTVVCRAKIGDCDVPENCNGSAKACPTDVVKAANTACSTDNNGCTDDICNESGACTHPANLAACNDGSFCNGADTCAAGICSNHAGDPCPGPDNDENCAESCSEATDSCTSPDLDSSSCNDGDHCTNNDTCTAGICAGVPGDACGTTTTTLPSDPCGDPNDDGRITASDALTALGAAVGSRVCAIWHCDFNGDGKVTAGDALSILRVAVGQEVLARCPDAEPSKLHAPTSWPTTAAPASTTSTTVGAP